MKKLLWISIVILAIIIGIMALLYSIYGVNQGFIELKPKELLRNNVWWAVLYAHISTGGVSILIGWLQFSNKLRLNRRNLHKLIGKVYFFTFIICSITGLYVGFYASGGWFAKLGFMSVASIAFYTTLKGFLAIRSLKITAHQNFMTYSYATCLAAVTLRFETPLSILFTDDYLFSYSIIAWTAWIPNLIVAWWINNKRGEDYESFKAELA
jgi:uncharacterized membrane protein